MGDYRTTTGEKVPMPPRQRRRRLRQWLVGGCAALIAIVLGGSLVRVDRVVTAQGHVMTDVYAEVYASIDGRVARIEVSNGDRVEEGQAMVRLEDVEEQTLLAEAQIQHRKAVAEMERREAEIAERRRAHQDDVRVARLRLENARAKHARSRELVERRLAAASALEDFRLQEELVTAELEALLAADLTVFDGELRVMALEVEARTEAVSRAEARLSRCVVRAPIAGLVVRYDFGVGEQLRPDRLLYEIFGDAPPVLKVRVRERDAVRVEPGQRYRAELTPFGGWGRARFDGKVLYLRDVIQTDARGGYRMATCTFDPGGLQVPMGASAEVRIRGGRAPFWSWLFGLDG